MNKKVAYKNITDNLLTSLIFFVFSILLEIAFCLCTFGQLLTYIAIPIGITMFLSVIIFLLPTFWVRTITSGILLLAQLVINIVNNVLYKSTGELFTSHKLKLIGEATEATTGTLINFGVVLLLFLIFAGAIVCFVFSKKFSNKFVYRPSILSFIAVILIFQLSSFLLFTLSVKPKEDRILFSDTYVSVERYKKFGYYGFYVANILNAINNPYKLTDEEKTEFKTYIADGWNTETTQYSNLLKDDNLIIILTESVEFFGIDSYFTPNLHKLYFENSLLFENYYTENKTNMSEGMALMGTYSFTQPLITSSGTSMTSVLKNLSLANSFKNNNAKTTYIHGYNKTFYNRDVTFNKLGFDNLIFAADQETQLKQFEQENNNSYNWSTANFYEFVKDSSFVKYNIESFVPNTGKFFTTFASFTTHGDYVERGSNLSYYNQLTSAENQEKLNELINSLTQSGYNITGNLNQFLYYKAAMMDLDKTIEIIFDRLEETNNLDNTTIVLYSDHNAYYDDFGLKVKNLSSFSIEGYHLPAAIYSTKLYNTYNQNNSTTRISKFVSVNDLYPTICDLFGFTFNKNLCYGKNIFSNENNLFISLKDRIIFDNNFYYFNSPVAINSNVSVDYFRTEVDKILYKVNVFENLFNNLDFFESLFEN